VSFELEPELEMLRDVVARFVAERIRPAEARLQLDEYRLPDPVVLDLQNQARVAGLWYFDTPADLGGAGLSAFQSVVVWEAATRHRLCFPTIGGGAFGYTPPFVLFAARPEQIDRWVRPAVENGWVTFNSIAEATGGTDVARAIRTTATRDGDGWVLNGTKMWATNAERAKFGVVYARAEEGISCFVVETDAPGVTVSPISVIRDGPTNVLQLDNVVLDADHLVGEAGRGLGIASNWLQRGRLMIAARSVGVAEQAVALAVDWVNNRETFGALLATRQAVQFAIADSRVEIEAARQLTWHAAWKHDRPGDARRDIAIAKLYASEMAFRVVDRMMQIHGAMGMARELPLEGWLRELRVYRVAEGSSEILRSQIARTEIGPSVRG
jgi:acyl-CoA dehydrogenase